MNPRSQGLGLKIFGGVSSRGDEHGIFVKQVVPGGLAALSGRLQPGDELLEVRTCGMLQPFLLICTVVHAINFHVK